MISAVLVRFQYDGNERKTRHPGYCPDQFDLASIPEVVTDIEWFPHDYRRMRQEQRIIDRVPTCGMNLRRATEYDSSWFEFEPKHLVDAVNGQIAKNQVR